MWAGFAESHVEGLLLSNIIRGLGGAGARNRACDTNLAVSSDLQADPQPVSVYGVYLQMCRVMSNAWLVSNFQVSLEAEIARLGASCGRREDDLQLFF